MSVNKITKRNESVKSIIRSKETSESDRNIIKNNLQIQNVMNISNNGVICLGLFLLYKKNFFAKTSKFFFKESCLITGMIGYNLGFKYYSSEFMWKKNKDIIRKYALIKEREFYELKKQSKNYSKKSEKLYD